VVDVEMSSTSCVPQPVAAEMPGSQPVAAADLSAAAKEPTKPPLAPSAGAAVCQGDAAPHMVDLWGDGADDDGDDADAQARLEEMAAQHRAKRAAAKQQQQQQQQQQQTQTHSSKPRTNTDGTAGEARQGGGGAVAAIETVVLDIKPWEDSTDLDAMEKAVRALQSDGEAAKVMMRWGRSERVNIGYGIRALRIECMLDGGGGGGGSGCIEEAIEQVEELDEWVQSCGVVDVEMSSTSCVPQPVAAEMPGSQPVAAADLSAAAKEPTGPAASELTATEPEPASTPAPAPEPMSGSEPKSEPECKIKVEPEPKTQSKPGLEPKPQPVPAPKTEAEGEAKPEEAVSAELDESRAVLTQTSAFVPSQSAPAVTTVQADTVAAEHQALLLSSVHSRRVSTRKLREALSSFDSDGNGVLSAAEFHCALSTLSIEVTPVRACMHITATVHAYLWRTVVCPDSTTTLSHSRCKCCLLATRPLTVDFMARYRPIRTGTPPCRTSITVLASQLITSVAHRNTLDSDSTVHCTTIE
jgi:translation elongation factor EF-1beta